MLSQWHPYLDRPKLDHEDMIAWRHGQYPPVPVCECGEPCERAPEGYEQVTRCPTCLREEMSDV